MTVQDSPFEISVPWKELQTALYFWNIQYFRRDVVFDDDDDCDDSISSHVISMVVPSGHDIEWKDLSPFIHVKLFLLLLYFGWSVRSNNDFDVDNVISKLQ